MNERMITEIDGLRRHMEEKKVTAYKLCKLTGIKRSTLYAYVGGRLAIPEMKCRIIADALGVEVADMFPQIVDPAPALVDARDPGSEDYQVEQTEEIEKPTESDKTMTNQDVHDALERKQLTVNDMVAGAACSRSRIPPASRG